MDDYTFYLYIYFFFQYLKTLAANSVYTAPNDSMTVKDEWDRMWKGITSYLRYNSDIFRDGIMKKKNRNVSEDSQCRGKIMLSQKRHGLTQPILQGA